MRARRSCTAELLHHDHGRCATCSLLIPSALVADLATLVSDEVLVHLLRCFGIPVEVRLIASSSRKWMWSWNAGTSPSCSDWMRRIVGCTYRTGIFAATSQGNL